MTRFAADDPSAAHTFVGALDDTITIGGHEGHHLERVRRMRAGERITVADGQGKWRPYRIVETHRDALDLRADGDPALEPALAPRLRVAFAVTKAAKPDLVVQKLTELGVDRITPLTTRRSVPRWDDDRAEAMSTRLRRVAREAAAQCRRARLPDVDEPQPLATVCGVPGVVVADPGGDAIAGIPAPPAGEWVLVVGPEGGFDADELDVLWSPSQAAAPHRLRLGPHVLRAETAAIAGAAVLTARRHPCG